MITSIRLKNFKNFADETLRVGPFTILVGANASGKSNIRDAFRFLHGIGRGYSLEEILGGKREAGWKPIRGAMNEVTRFEQEAFVIEVGLKLNGEELLYSIEAGRSKEMNNRFLILKEELRAESKRIYSQDHPSSSFNPYYPALSRFESHFLGYSGKFDDVEWADVDSEKTQILDYSEKVMGEFRRMRFLDPSPEKMREPTSPDGIVLGDTGENLPTVLERICSDQRKQEILADWLQELTPMDVESFKFRRDPNDRVHLRIREKKGREISAHSASDGTLRFLAVLAVLLGSDPACLYFFEEIDTGIHPARQWLLLELIEKQTAKNNIQVITTTHASDLLTFVNDSTFEDMSVVYRPEDSQDALIRSVAKLPNARKLRTSQGGLGRLLASRWMETALAFTEDYDEAEDDL